MPLHPTHCLTRVWITSSGNGPCSKSAMLSSMCFTELAPMMRSQTAILPLELAVMCHPPQPTLFFGKTMFLGHRPKQIQRAKVRIVPVSIAAHTALPLIRGRSVSRLQCRCLRGGSEGSDIRSQTGCSYSTQRRSASDRERVQAHLNGIGHCRLLDRRLVKN